MLTFLTFNQTNVELKFFIQASSKIFYFTFNQTNVELKFKK